MKFVPFFVGILLSCSVFASEYDPIFLLTLPKSGTHMFLKYFNMLGETESNLKFPYYRSHMSESHLGLEKGYFNNQNVKKILLVRDLRDIFISTANWLEESKNYLTSQVYLHPKWFNLSLDKKILELSNYQNTPYHIKWEYKNRTLPQQLKKMVDRAIELSKCPNSLVVTYEDLSGGNGKEIQIATMKKINAFIGVTLEEHEYLFLAENLFGGTFSFRVGKINKWKTSLSSSSIAAINSLWENELFELGYNTIRKK